MKIVHFSSTYINHWAYQENILPEYFQREGFDVTVITLCRVPDFKQDVQLLNVDKVNNVNIIRLKVLFFLSFNFFFPIKLYKTLRQERPDILFHHNTSLFSLTICTLYKIFNPACKLFADNHADFINRSKSKIKFNLFYRVVLRTMCKAYVPFVDMFYGVSPGRVDFLKSVLKIPDCKVKFLPIGTDTYAVNNLLKNKEQLKEKYNIPNDEFIVISGGKNGIDKGTHNLIEAVESLRKEGNKIKLILFGFFDKDLIDLLQKPSESILNFGWLDRQNALELLTVSDVGIWPVHHTTLIEDCIACNVPVILRKTATTEHLIKNNGLFIYNSRVENIKDAINKIMTSDKDYLIKAAASINHQLDYKKNVIDILADSGIEPTINLTADQFHEIEINDNRKLKILITHLTFNVYFPPRLYAFQKLCEKNGYDVHFLEISKKRIDYPFATDEGKMSLNHEYLIDMEKNPVITKELISERLNQRLNELLPDVVIGGAIAFPSGAVALRWAKLNKRPFITFDNARKVSFRRSWYVDLIKKIVFKNVDAFFCPAPAWNESLKHWGFKPEQIFYGLNVVDNSFWKKTPVSDSFKDTLPNNSFLLVGRQVEIKNQHLFLEAYIQYRKRGGKTPLILVGDGICHNDLVSMVSGLVDVYFVKFISQSQIKEVFLHARFLFLPSLYEETWGNIVNEAMASGVPVALSNECGSSTTLVMHEINGYIFNPHSVQEMINTMNLVDGLKTEDSFKFIEKGSEIISKWDLDRYSTGLMNAVEYVRTRKTKFSFYQLILLLWNGKLPEGRI